MDPDQGDRSRVRHEPGPGGGRRTIPARCRGPLAGRRGRPHQAGRRRPSPGRQDNGDNAGRTERAAQSWSKKMSVLEMRRVSRTYGLGVAEVHALRDIDLSVDAGVMVAVMGPSGSGKSTLLTIAGSLEDASSGEVSVCGQKLTSLSRNAKARLRRRSIGYVFQDFNLLPGLTAAENVTLPLELDGVPARKARAAGLRSLAELGLGDRAEPSGALDSANGEGVMRLIHAACKRGLAAVVVTHDAQLASWADRVVFLRDGCVVDQTAPLPGPESLLTPGQNP